MIKPITLTQEEKEQLFTAGWTNSVISWDDRDEQQKEHVHLKCFIAARLPSSSIAKKLLASDSHLDYPSSLSVILKNTHLNEIKPWLDAALKDNSRIKPIRITKLTCPSLLEEAFLSGNTVACQYLLSKKEKMPGVTANFNLYYLIKNIASEPYYTNSALPALMTLRELTEDNNQYQFLSGLTFKEKVDFFDDLVTLLINEKSNKIITTKQALDFLTHFLKTLDDEPITKQHPLLLNTFWAKELLGFKDPIVIDWYKNNLDEKSFLKKYSLLIPSALSLNYSTSSVTYMIQALNLDINERCNDENNNTPVKVALLNFGLSMNEENIKFMIDHGADLYVEENGHRIHLTKWYEEVDDGQQIKAAKTNNCYQYLLELKKAEETNSLLNNQLSVPHKKSSVRV